LKLPQLTAKELAKAIDKIGFKFKRQHGSHMFFEHSDERTTIIPKHPGEKIDRGLLNKIIKHDIKISRQKLIKLVKK